MVQVARTNGHAKKKARRVFTARDWKKWVRWSQRIGPLATAERFGIVPSMIHNARARLEASGDLPGKARRAKSKARREVSRAKPGGRQGPRRASPRASYKAAGAHKKGAGIGDAVVYLTHALDRLEPLGREVYPIAGLIGLALEALGAR